MHSGNIDVLENFIVDTPFDSALFLDQINIYVPDLDPRNQWIRSGNRIADKYKNLISSYRLLSSYRPNDRHASVEVLLIKPQPLSPINETETTTLEFIREYQLENRVSVIFAAMPSAGGETWRSFMTINKAEAGIALPCDLVSYLAVSTLKKYLKKTCRLSDAALDGYFCSNRIIYDDTAIKNSARQIDKALADIEVCDFSAGSGCLLAALGERIASIRGDISKYIGGGSARTKERFLAHFAERSLYATDLDAGALELLKLCLGKTCGRHIPAEHVVYGSILTEDIFDDKKFDVIISNPPHMRQEEFAAIKGSFSNYKVFHKSADLYCYYIERALSMLKDGGCAGIITSNRWMRSEYGAPLRAFLSKYNVSDLLDYGNIPTVRGIATPMSTLTILNSPDADGKIKVATIVDRKFEDAAKVTENESSLFARAGLGENPWVFEASSLTGLTRKIAAAGVQLEKYVNGGIYRGILTGFNEAFVIDVAKAKDFIRRDVRSAQLLRPFAGGRNIRRYAKPLIKKYLLFIPKGFTDKARGENDPWDWFSSNYPIVAEHLLKFRRQARARRDRGDYWWELRSCKYYGVFEQGKIISPAIVKRISATMDTEGVFSNDKTSVIATDDYYLLGLLNSRMMDFYARRITTGLLNDYFELKPANLSVLPIKNISKTNSFQIKLKDTIAENARKLLALAGAQEDGNANIVAEAERTVNRAVYALYKLSAKEISMIENN